MESTYRWDGGRIVYCRADRYEEMASRIAEGYETDVLTYEYEKYDEEEWFVSATCTLTEEQAAAVLEVYSTVIPTTPQDGMEFFSDYCVSIYGGSQDGMFSRYLFDIELAGNTYYITEYPEEEGKVLLYRVPEDKASLFAAVLKPMIEAQEKISAEWDETNEDTLFL